jgi:hypothetical protein
LHRNRLAHIFCQRQQQSPDTHLVPTPATVVRHTSCANKPNQQESPGNISHANTQDVILLRGVLFDLNFQQEETIVIYEDNIAAIKWSSGSSRRAKHFDHKGCFVHEIVSRTQAILQYVPTSDQLADILTMPLETNIFSFIEV